MDRTGWKKQKSPQTTKVLGTPWAHLSRISPSKLKKMLEQTNTKHFLDVHAQVVVEPTQVKNMRKSKMDQIIPGRDEI